MAKSDTPTRRLSDWVILILVLVIMGLLIVDLAKNVRDAAKLDLQRDHLQESPTLGRNGPATSTA